MTKNLLILVCLSILTSLTDSCFGQDLNLLNSKTIFAIGEITSLPDTIYLVEREDQIGELQNYTRLERTNRNHFKTWFWKMDNGGLVDPAISKHELSLSMRKSMTILKFRHNKKTYFSFPLKDKSGQKILLVENK